ncbi:uncharacterized protein LOC127032928 isoform X1 [Gopherus flavomarginatus]|uniref:uncharacterized protein LOC127032928 isoform X1 n=1 Tax=Gopherus flavomarginatus TaxID=286002 RepID=UPI0021CC4A31|nr:uncharacterized protein LOC127032928 isoform X1 [Gopherus flavomarginatus]
MLRGPPHRWVATWRQDRVPPKRRKHSTGGNANDVTTSVLDPEGTQVSEEEGWATPQSTSSSETWQSSSPDRPHVDSSGCGVPCSPGPADTGVRAGLTEPCTRPECERMRQELEALRDRYAKVEAQNAVLAQKLGGDVEPPGETESESVRPEPGLFEDPAVPRKYGMQELVPGGGVFLYPAQLALARSSARSQTALARLLLDVFFSRQEQARSNLSGENGLRRLSPPVVSAIVGESGAVRQWYGPGRRGQAIVWTGRGNDDTARGGGRQYCRLGRVMMLWSEGAGTGSSMDWEGQ